MIVPGIRGLREASKKCSSIANIKMADDISVDEFTKDLMIGEALGSFKSRVSRSTFSRTNEFGKHISISQMQRDRIMLIRFMSRRLVPAMCLEDTIKVSLTGQLDVVASLMDVNTIVAKSKSLAIIKTDTFELGHSMVIDDCDKLLSSSRRGRSNSKVINLVADKDEFTINFTMIKIMFMSHRGEAELIAFQNTNNHLLPENTSFRMTLNGMLNRNDMCTRVNVSTKAFAIPGVVSIIDLKVALLSQRWRLLKGILGVSNGNNQTLGSSNSKEEAHAGLLNTGSIGLNKLMEPGSSTFGTIETGATLVSTIGLDEIGPMLMEDVWFTTIRQSHGMWNRKTIHARLPMSIKLSIKGRIPVSPIGEPLKILASKLVEVSFLISHVRGLQAVKRKDISIKALHGIHHFLISHVIGKGSKSRVIFRE